MARKRRDSRRAGRQNPKQAQRSAERLESYRAFIEDWDAFQEAIRRPEPLTFRTNTVRITREALAGRLEAQGFAVVPVDHQPAFLQVVSEPEGRSLSDTLEHWLGLFYIQQTATGWAAPLLAPEAGDRVLDLCSAPGGKTTHLAELLGESGTVVASDVNESRIRALLGNIYRLGHTNIMTVAGDGRRFPTGATFDRVMVDVPCSAEGTLRKRGGRLPGQSRKWTRQVAKAQEKLLRRAVELTRPGGTLLYVTCTFGPQENEAILTRVLGDTDLTVEPLELPVPHARGLSSFRDDTYDPSLAGAVRLYPHHLDSGGLFLCRLRKGEEGAEDAGTAMAPYAGDGSSSVSVRGWAPVPAVFPEAEESTRGAPQDSEMAPEVEGEPQEEAAVRADLELAGSFLEARLGVVPDVLAPLSWIRRGTNLWAHSLEAWPWAAWKAGGHWRVVAVGFRAFDLGGDGPPRPTNDLLGWLADRVPQRVELSAERWARLLEDRTLPDPGPDGLVALAHDGVVLARGYRRDGDLRHEVPKGRLRWLGSVMEGRRAASGE